MILLEKKYNKIFNFFLILIAATFFFRKLCTIILIIFIFFSIINFKKLNIRKENIHFLFIISSPFLIQLFFFWNNDDWVSGLKSLEKVIMLLLFPIIIVGNLKRVRFLLILHWYTILSVFMITLLFVRFMFISPKFFDVYLKGHELWESGYKFAHSFGMHAPALNMHLAFVSIGSLWLLFKALRNNNFITVLLKALVFCLSFFFILVVNTRLALGEVFIGFLLLIFFEIKRSKNYKNFIKISILLFVTLSMIFSSYVFNNPFMKEKYFNVTFAHIDKVGKLDEVENPEAEIYNSLVTRLSIWKSSYKLAINNITYGVGAADSNRELFKYYKNTNQFFLERNKFPPHNQFLNHTIKFGFLGFVVIFMYIFFILYLGIKTKKPIIISFFIIFLLSNLVDDFLIRFDGIIFSGFWISLFCAYYVKDSFKKHTINNNC